MIEFTEEQMEGIAATTRARLRPVILARWYDSLREAGDEVGATGRERVLAEIDLLALDDGWDTADLLMLADVMLVALAEQDDG